MVLFFHLSLGSPYTSAQARPELSTMFHVQVGVACMPCMACKEIPNANSFGLQMCVAISIRAAASPPAAVVSELYACMPYVDPNLAFGGAIWARYA